MKGVWNQLEAEDWRDFCIYRVKFYRQQIFSCARVMYLYSKKKNTHRQLNVDKSSTYRILSYIIEIILMPLHNIQHYSHKYSYIHVHTSSNSLLRMGSFAIQNYYRKKPQRFKILVINKLFEKVWVSTAYIYIYLYVVLVLPSTPHYSWPIFTEYTANGVCRNICKCANEFL